MDDPLGAWKINQESTTTQQTPVQRETLAEKLARAKEQRNSGQFSQTTTTEDTTNGNNAGPQYENENENSNTTDKYVESAPVEEVPVDEEEEPVRKPVNLFSHISSETKTAEVLNNNNSLLDDDLLDGFLDDEDPLVKSFEKLEMIKNNNNRSSVGSTTKKKTSLFSDDDDEEGDDELFNLASNSNRGTASDAKKQVNQDFDFEAYISQQSSTQKKGLFDD